MTKQLVQEINLFLFLKKTKEEQQEWMTKVKIDELKGDLPLLKKFIAIKVFIEARRAAEDHSSFNLTASFRDFLATFSEDLHLKASLGSSDSDEQIESEIWRGTAGNCYRFFHVSDMGAFFWNRKIFNLGFDKDYNVVTVKGKTQKGLSSMPITSFLEEVTWELHKEEQLKALFAEIKKETSYENTLGYDLLSAAMYCANSLLELSINNNCNLLFIPLALALNLAIYAVVMPPALALVALEHLIINPLKWVIDLASPNEYEAFIEEVTGALAISI